jgi:hypothetical protein
MTDMKYVRLFAGPDGESHFEDIAFEFNSEPPMRFPVSEWQPAVIFMNFPPELPPEMHRARARLLHILVAGSWAMQTSDGEVRHFHPGDVVLAEDMTGKGFMTWTTSQEPAMLARIQLSG